MIRIYVDAVGALETNAAKRRHAAVVAGDAAMDVPVFACLILRNGVQQVEQILRLHLAHVGHLLAVG